MICSFLNHFYLIFIFFTVVKATIHSKKRKTSAGSKKVKGKVVYESLEICSSIDCCKPLDRKATVAWVSYSVYFIGKI